MGVFSVKKKKQSNKYEYQVVSSAATNKYP